MIVGTTSQSAITRVLCRKARALALIAVGSVVMACSLESTLDSLANQFPRHKSELSRLVSVWQTLHSEVSLNGYMNGYTRYCESPPCVRIGNGEEQISIKVAQQRFPKSSDQLTQLAKLAESLKLDYVSLEFDEYFVSTMKGGGALGGDSGYLFAPNGSSPHRAVKHFKPIPNESYWYAFVG